MSVSTVFGYSETGIYWENFTKLIGGISSTESPQIPSWRPGSFSFAQRWYSNQWSNKEMLLLLVENYTQYPALLVWNITSRGNFWRPQLELMQVREIRIPRRTPTGWTRPKNVYSTMYSQAVTHPSTNMAQCCLTSVIGRELVFSTWYGRRQRVSGQFNLLRGLSSVQQKSTHILQTEMMGVTHLLWKWIKQLIAWSSKTG